ncbi:MAG: hypothetical protein JXB07_15005 [Anaerolineae bacterium]|nr:hypothetical protein [Anaerolineae bacterium]
MDLFAPKTTIGPLIVLGGMGLQPVSAPLWRELLTLLPRTAAGIIIFSLAAEPHKASYEQRIKQAEEMFCRLDIATQTIRAHPLANQEQPPLLQPSDGIFLIGDEPRALSTISQSAIWQQYKAGAAVIATASMAAALGEHTFAPIKPYPPTLIAQEFERLPGAGLLPGAAILPYFDRFPNGLLSRLEQLFPPGIALVGIDEQAALVADIDGCHVAGLGNVTILRHNEADLVAEAGTRIPDELLYLHR